MTKFCNHCKNYKSESLFTFYFARSHGRERKVSICESCQANRLQRRTLTERDKFGLSVTEANKTTQSNKTRTIAELKKHEHDV